MSNSQYHKLRLHLRGWLQGRAEENPSYYLPLKALEFAERYHTGKRKDGVTPEYQHQMEIAQYLRTQARSLLFPAETIAAALLHDVMEDYDIPMEVMVAEFGERIAQAVWKLTKVHCGVKKSMEEYFREIATCPIASAVKGADRVNNLQSMLGVFTIPKQISYAQEVRDLFLPMLKTARRLFPQQESVYQNIKLVLTSQLEMLAAIHAALSSGPIPANAHEGSEAHATAG
jgi:(p)ppGpp synthase/HD superfamily hydrolase